MHKESAQLCTDTLKPADRRSLAFGRRLPSSGTARQPNIQAHHWRIAFAALVVAVFVVRILYLLKICPYDLAPDEAHYWDWSRHLDWSYYSKGPLVAWLIHGSCWLFGPLSESLLGSEILAVRLPAAICGSFLLISLYTLVIQVFQNDRLAFATTCLALTIPIFSLGGIVMTIDAPYTCLWGWALVFGHRAVFRGSTWAWIATGLAVGLGVLAKYTMILWLPSLGLFLLFSAVYRHLLFSRAFWLMVAVTGFCCLPILIWNLQNGWVTFRHVGGQAGLTGEKGILWLGPLNYLGLQAALLLGSWFVVWVLAMWQGGPNADLVRFLAFLPPPLWGRVGGGTRQDSTPHPSPPPQGGRGLENPPPQGGRGPERPDFGKQYLWWMSAPMFLIFFGFSLKTWGEPNWPITAYLSGFVLATAWIGRQLVSGNQLWRGLVLASLILTSSLGVALSAIMYDSDLAHPLLARIVGEPSEKNPLPLRRFDPTCRLRGWSELAAEVDRIRANLRQHGIEPVIAASSWTIPGELGFYCSGHPQVYSLGLAQGDRHSQYDLWHPNPIDDDSEFLGQNFIVVGDLALALRTAFAEVETLPRFIHEVNGQPIASWQIHIGRCYLGVKHIPAMVKATRQATF